MVPKKKLGLVITDGVGYRNFVLSDFLSEAQKCFDEVVVLSYLPRSVYAQTHCRIIELEAQTESFGTWFFRKLKDVAHLKNHQNGNFGISDNLLANASKAKTPRGYATRLVFKLTDWFHSEKHIQRFDRLQQFTFSNNHVSKKARQILREENFDLLFFTHQRPPYIAPMAYQAQQLKLKTACFIFSWDNLASKGRMAAQFDHYLVWSDLMKTELLQFYPLADPQKVAVVGTPQFESYVLDRYTTDKATFFHKFDLDPNLKTICFSCGDLSTSRNDELYISTIAEALLSRRIADANFIVRTSPAEDPVRFASLVERYPMIRWNYPKWILARKGHQEEWSQRIPTTDDVKDLRALLEFSDVNVNMLSTMSLDFMQFDKPVINTVFGNAANGLYNDQRFLNYAHIEHLVNSGATQIVKDKQPLIDALNDYLKNPEIDADKRAGLLQLQISRPLQGTGKRIAQTLLEWS